MGGYSVDILHLKMIDVRNSWGFALGSYVIIYGSPEMTQEVAAGAVCVSFKEDRDTICDVQLLFNGPLFQEHSLVPANGQFPTPCSWVFWKVFCPA